MKHLYSALLCIAVHQCFPHIDFTWAGRPGILTAAQVYLVTHFCFYYYYYLLHFFFLSARDNETIRDRITSGKSPLAQRVSYCSFCVLKSRRHSHSVSHTLIHLWRAATISTARCHQPRVSHTHEHNFSTIFSNFQTLLAAFSP